MATVTVTGDMRPLVIASDAVYGRRSDAEEPVAVVEDNDESRCDRVTRRVRVRL